MEKNWIEKIKEVVRVAMNKGLAITNFEYPKFKYIKLENEIEFGFDIQNNLIRIFTPKGKFEGGTRLQIFRVQHRFRGWIQKWLGRGIPYGL